MINDSRSRTARADGPHEEPRRARSTRSTLFWCPAAIVSCGLGDRRLSSGPHNQQQPQSNCTGRRPSRRATKGTKHTKHVVLVSRCDRVLRARRPAAQLRPAQSTTAAVELHGPTALTKRHEGHEAHEARCSGVPLRSCPAGSETGGSAPARTINNSRSRTVRADGTHEEARRARAHEARCSGVPLRSCPAGSETGGSAPARMINDSRSRTARADGPHEEPRRARSTRSTLFWCPPAIGACGVEASGV